jgi:hypothetical protein
MDLYPEALASAGKLAPESFAYRFLAWLNGVGLARATGIVCLGESQRHRLRDYRNGALDHDRCAVVPPWDHRPIPHVSISTNRVIQRFGWQNRKVALYAGNLGEGHTFHEIVEAARWCQCQGRSDWLFVFVVRGAGRVKLESSSAGLSNVQIMDYLPEDQTADLLWSATVHLISMKPGWEGVVVPSKLYGVLQTDRPILFIGPDAADTAREIRRLGAGDVLPPNVSGEAVTRALDELANPVWRKMRATNHSGPDQVAAFITR